MADAFEDEPEQTVSIQDYLKGVEEQELEADLILGADEGNECSYTNGYIKRQAVFSCLTCTPEGNAGVCTACSLSCHDSHEVFLPQSFQRVTGNSKFGDFFCKLFPNKDIENAENMYNHNFRGSYCTCGRPYPDPDVEEQVEMIQCCICEDWFHEEHLGLETSNEVPRDEEGEPLYEDFICRACSTSFSFLGLYPPSIWPAGRQCDVTLDANKDKNIHSNANSESASNVNGLSLGEDSQKVVSNQCVKDTSPHPACVLGVNLEAASPALDGRSLFLSRNWRDVLCRCEKCLVVYNQKRIAFLLDKEDSSVEYEKMARRKRKEKLLQQVVTELSLFDKLGHIQKMEILSGIADMKDEIRGFLESFDSSKSITTANVHKVFENLAKKRHRIE
ncbi:hypothetical protein I3760_12G080400 [Carya illinoinensis]|nr:hypothetical protein I3760_12G080400 [Carya illinoinensis]